MKYVNLKKLLDWLVSQYENSHGVVSYTIFAVIEYLQGMKNEMGTWEEYSSEHETAYVCSECKCVESKATPFCPHCGLPMEVGA